jgi:hypothetical protein
MQRGGVDAGILQYVGHQARQMLQMRPRGNFRHNAAKGCMFCLLAKNRLSQDRAISAQHSRRGFIAATFDTKNAGVGFHVWTNTMTRRYFETAQLPAAA